MTRSTREKIVVDAFAEVLEKQDGERLVLEQPSEGKAPPARDHRHASPYLFAGRSGCVLVELRELFPPTPHQLRRSRTRRIHEALASVTWPAGSYAVEVLTHDDRQIKKLIASDEFTALLQAVAALEPTSGFGSDVNAYAQAFYRRDPRYFTADSSQIMLVSKQSAAGTGIIINGPHDSEQSGTITLSDREGQLLEIATTSRSYVEPEVLESSLEELFIEADGRFDDQSDCRGILLVDVGGYPAGPLIIEAAVNKCPLERWPRISEVVLFVDEPHSTPPPASGVVSGIFRFWRIKASS